MVVGVVVAAVVALVIIVVWVIFLCALYHIHKNKKRAIEVLYYENIIANFNFLLHRPTYVYVYIHRLRSWLL